MKKRSRQRKTVDLAHETPIHIHTYDCGSLTPYIHAAIAAGRRPTKADLAIVRTYSTTKLSVQMRRLYREEQQGQLKLYHYWEDCLGYALCLQVSEKAAEENCPKKRWLHQDAR